MLFLKTLGGLSVHGDGAVAKRAAQRRKTLALLALVAASRRGGISRDKLIAYLWPESDAEHARQVLKQTCYSLRRDLHAPELFLGAVELRLNPDVVTSDIGTLEEALDRGAWADAATAYTGPFLDGFYLAGASDFERWVEETRTRLKGRVAAALESLANEAAARGEHRKEVEWWRRLAALEPLSSRVALALMNSLAAAGDRSGALQVARVHETLFREEFDAAPDAAVLELTRRLRDGSEAAGVVGPRAERSETAIPKTMPLSGESAEVAPTPLAGRGVAAVRSWRPNRKAAAAALALLAGGLLTSGWLLYGLPVNGRSAVTASMPKRVLVLPFANLGSPEDAYFANGMTEEIAARLGGTGSFHIIGSASASRYRDTKKPLPEIAKELGVDYVLEGSVRWQKSLQGPARVRVTPRLVSTRDDTQLWAQVYDEPLDEIFRVQSDIAQKVVGALDVALLEPQRRAVDAVPTRNLEAYDYYLRGNDYVRRGGDEPNLRAAARLYEKAVELDPAFALAYSSLSRMHTRIYWRYYDHSKERLEHAKRAAERALELAPDLPETHQALAIYYGLGLRDYDRAMREYALAEARGGTAFLGRAVVRLRQGKIRESLADYEKARRVDPASSMAASNSGHPYDLLREHPRAEELYDRAIALAPGRTDPYLLKIWLYLRWDGSTRRARAVLREAEAAGAAKGPGVLHARVLMEIFDRRYETALALLSSESPEIVVSDDFRVVPRAQHYALIYGLMRRPELARAYYDSARSILYKRVQEDPTDPRLRTALGIAYAGLGRNQEALQEGLEAVELMPISGEAFRGYHHEWELARIYTMVGEHELAIRKLEYLLSIPGQLTAAWLRMDPVWDPLRSHPRFQKLVGRAQ